MTELGGAGPKAESLRRMSAAGLPVPEARFIGAGAYREHADRAGVPALVEAAADPAAVRAAIEAAPVDPALDGVLRDWWRDLGAEMLAVRSSGTAEDLPGMSFAGQHGTYFVSDADSLVARVRDCWASLFTDRAVAYRLEHGVPHDSVAMGVIVQRLVDARAAGVAFTEDPITGSDDSVIVEACLGLGEALVSGKVSPDRFVFARPGLALSEKSAGDKRIRVAPDGSGGVGETAVPADEAGAFAIDDARAREVAELSLRAARAIGASADVEWAFDGESVWLLQARPITAAARPAVAATTATPIIWSNVNTGEILPDVATPMTWSVIHGHAEQIFGGMFGALGVHVDSSRLVGLVGGRVYFNLSMLRESFAHFPGMDPDTMLGGMHDYVQLPPLEPVRGRPTWPALLRAAVSMPAYVIRHRPGKAPRFAASMREVAESSIRAAAAAPDAESAYRLFLDLETHFDDFNDALAFMAVAMLGYGLLGGLTRKWLGDTTGSLASRLVAGSGDVVSAESGHALWRLSARARASQAVRGPLLVGIGWDDVRDRLEAAAGRDPGVAEFLASWDAFMTEYGHHRRGELELANPTWAERPEYVLGIVRAYVVEEAGDDPLAAYERRAEDAETAAGECRARLGSLKRAAFGRVLGWGRASARTRENIKSEAVRWFVAIRHALLAVGARLVEAGTLESAEDVFFVECGELDELVHRPGKRDWRALVATRRAEHARFAALSPPPVVVGDWDERAGWDVSEHGRTLKGISVSSGVARGRARVFLSADTDDTVYPGEILVAPFTDPGWTPYFVPAAGIVMDMGGLLSHGSIIAREYGIPAVVNVGPATRIISTGNLIEVDGDAGEVRILSS